MPDIESLLKEKRVFKPSIAFTRQANWNKKTVAEYRKLGAKSPERFWAKMAREHVDWFSPWKKVLDWKSPFSKWFVGAKLNVSHNCLDRHIEGENGWRRNKKEKALNPNPNSWPPEMSRRSPRKRKRACSDNKK